MKVWDLRVVFLFSLVGVPIPGRAADLWLCGNRTFTNNPVVGENCRAVSTSTVCDGIGNKYFTPTKGAPSLSVNRCAPSGKTSSPLVNFKYYLDHPQHVVEAKRAPSVSLTSGADLLSKLRGLPGGAELPKIDTSDPTVSGLLDLVTCAMSAGLSGKNPEDCRHGNSLGLDRISEALGTSKDSH